MKLFDECERTYLGPAAYNEPSFVYLNKSSRPLACALRSIIEKWFQEIKSNNKADLRCRFRSNDDTQHLSAFFELYCYALLSSHGLLVVHQPDFRKSVPDFLVQSPTDMQFLLECTVWAEKFIDPGAQQRLNELLAYLNSHLTLPNFFLYVHVRQIGQHMPKLRNLCSHIENIASKVDPDDLENRLKKHGVFSETQFSWSDGEWSLEFSFIPKKKESRGKPGLRPIGMIGYGARFIEKNRAATALLKALKEKAKKYRELELPLIIAVNVLGYSIEERDLNFVLFGQENRVAGDGFWLDKSGFKNSHVPAILFCSNLTPWTIHLSKPVLLHNPHATSPLLKNTWRGPQAFWDPASKDWMLYGGEDIFALQNFNIMREALQLEKIDE